MRHQMFLSEPQSGGSWQGGARNAASLPNLYSLAKCVVLGIAILSVPVSLQSCEPSRADTNGSLKKANNKMFDAEKMVEALVNHNPPPQIVDDGDARAVFPENYNWNEQGRVPKVIESLMEHAEEAWPELVNALNDKRYSVTFRIHDCPSNWSVGNVCAEIISDYLAQGYYFHDVHDAAEGRRWDIIMMNPVARKDLKMWCQERKDKKLYELQIETCEWAITKIPEFFPRASDNSRQKATEAIRAVIKSLNATKKPLRPQCFYMKKGAMGEGGGSYHERRL